MKFTTAALAFFISLTMSAPAPDAAPVGMVQRLDTRATSGDLIFGRSFSCPSNDPDVCCAASNPYNIRLLRGQSNERAAAVGNCTGYQIAGALDWGAGFQIPIIISQGFTNPEDIPSITAIILFFVNVGGGLLINAAQSAFVNELIASLPSTAPGVGPAVVVVTGVTELRSVFLEDQIPGILEAYTSGIQVAFALAPAACSVSFLVSLAVGRDWTRRRRRIDGGMRSSMAKLFAAQGYHIFATLRNTAKGKSLAAVSGVEILELEVISQESIEQCAAEVGKQTEGALDILINNAGADFVIPLLDVSMDEAKRLYDISVWSILGVTKGFAPMLIKAKGCVANFSSIAGILDLPTGSYYRNIRDLINDIRMDLTKPGAVDVDIATRAIVYYITSSKSGIIWRGGTAFLTRYPG
ncbi:hypothetical protein F5X99DRAFT_428050 [Biscogniauxia marginata]|nr:hypothetical protein F5X99DRAFT_428050 [Biscogniauxia marginata]